MTRTATILFFLWGLVHVVGGAVMLIALGGGPEAYLGTLTSVERASASLVAAGSPAAAVFGFHAWNILWIGAVVAVVAVTLNRKASPIGFWINLALVSGADLGLLIFLILPGVMTWASGAPGLILWIPAAATGFLALRGSVEAGRAADAPAS